jgi:hypothetical protein
VVKPGGRVAIVVWEATASEQGRLFEAVRGLFDKPPSGRGAFELAFPGELESLLAGLESGNAGQEARIEALDCPFAFATLDEALEGQLANGPSARAAEIFGRERVAGALRSALEQFVQPGGDVLIRNRFRIAVVAKPV